jgi:hypothetical protein
MEQATKKWIVLNCFTEELSSLLLTLCLSLRVTARCDLEVKVEEYGQSVRTILFSALSFIM